MKVHGYDLEDCETSEQIEQWKCCQEFDEEETEEETGEEE